MSYSLSRDTIICPSSTGLDCHGLHDRRSQDELWVSVCEWAHVGETVKDMGLEVLSKMVSVIWLRFHVCSKDTRVFCVCVCTCAEM